MAFNSITSHLAVIRIAILLFMVSVFCQYAAAQTISLACAAFYPDIGQRELFFRVTDDTAVNLQGLTLMQGDNSLAAQVEQIGSTVDKVSQLKAILGDELSDGADIEVAYKPFSDDKVAVARCIADLTADSDGDDLVDIADSAPFDADVVTVNTSVASADALATAPEEADAFYSRDVVIRSLLSADTFDYIEEVTTDNLVTKISDTAISPAAYFGIATADARVFRVDVSCDAVLDAARDLHLTKVRIGEHCVDVSDSFIAEAVGSRGYTWAEVKDGLLIASAYRSYDVAVLPEINISGRRSYLYDRPTTTTVAISAYVGSTTESVVVSVRGVSETAAVELNTENQFAALGDDSGTINAFYRATSEGRHPPLGGSVTRWLAGTEQVWQPSSDTMTVQVGGYPQFRAMRYAIGTDNYVEVAVSDVAMVRINGMFLYDVSEQASQRVLSMVGGRFYYVVADIQTNIADLAEQVSISSHLVDGYRIISTVTSVVNELQDAGHLVDAEYIEAIVLQAEATETTRTVSVGWDHIGNIVDISETYLVTASEPVHYGAADADGDRIPDSYDVYPNDSQTLQVVIADMIDREVDDLRTSDLQTLFLSDAGLIVAMGEGGDESVDYSAANRVYDDLSDGTQALLGLGDAQTAVGRIAMFGVNGVDYALGGGGEPVGGVAQVVFPMEASAGSILYLGGYNRKTQRWEHLERGDSSWYAIERTSDAACSGDLQKYKNEHRIAGAEGMGFMASAQNCIMLVMQDGAAYDVSSLDGRVVGLNGISAEPFRLSSVLHIAELADLSLVASSASYTIAIEITAKGGGDIRVSVRSDNSEVVSTTPTLVTIVGDENGTNIVDFELIPHEAGDAMVTVYATDGVSTATETFEVAVVASTAPTIIGVAVDETVSVLVDQAVVLDFTVSDADLDLVPNEHINVVARTKYNGLATLMLEKQSEYGYHLTITGVAEGSDEITLTATDSSGISTAREVRLHILTEPSTDEFVQSRFAGAPMPTVCVACRVAADGIARIRFDTSTVQLMESDDKYYVEFTVQLRKVGDIGTGVSYLSSVGFGLHYAASAFGDKLNDPAITSDGSGGSQCSYTRKAMFTDTGRSYNLSFRDVSVGELFGSKLIVDERNTHYDNLDLIDADVSSFSTLDEDWADVISLRCEIPSERIASEARLALSGEQARAVVIRKYPDVGDALQRPIFLLADNDLRGLRLDGKTYARDYVRYGDGLGVRLEFSKGIATQLTTQHFVIHTAAANSTATLPMISEVVHTPNSPYAHVLLSEPISGALMRLVSTDTTIVEDTEGNSLADGNFVAALEYDAAAPQVVSFTKDDTFVSLDGQYQSRWLMEFSAPIHAATVDVKHLCLTDALGVCPGISPVTPFISSVVRQSATMASVVINDGGEISSTSSLEFRRNAVLGGDFKVVEEYQGLLRDKIAIQDTVSPTLTVIAGNNGKAVITAESHTHITYDMSFTVVASESVVGLDDRSSYLLLRIPKDRETQTIETTPTVVQIVTGTESVLVDDAPTVTRVPNQENTVLVEYTNVRMEVATVKEIEGFTLGRMNDEVLDDMSGNTPVGMLEESDSTEPLDSEGVLSGRATAGTRAPSANARLIGLMLSDGTLTPTFSSATTVYMTVIPDATTSVTVIPTAAHAGAAITVNGMEVISGMPSLSIAIDRGVTTTIKIIVIAQDGTSNPYTVEVTRNLTVIRIHTRVFLEGLMR